jgi:hypothetical protein
MFKLTVCRTDRTGLHPNHQVGDGFVNLLERLIGIFVIRKMLGIGFGKDALGFEAFNLRHLTDRLGGIGGQLDDVGVFRGIELGGK